jgi:hypothetical protein
MNRKKPGNPSTSTDENIEQDYQNAVKVIEW